MTTSIQNNGKIIKSNGPLAVVYSCNICKAAIATYRKGRGGGRGYGLTTNHLGHAAVLNHIKEKHPA